MDIRLLKFYDAAFASVIKIRKKVFVEEQGVAEQEEYDLFDEKEQTDYCLLTEDIPCATGRLIQNDNGFKIGRVAVLKEYRGKGCGAAIVNALADRAFALGAPYVSLEAQLHAVPFYERLGFRVMSDEIIMDAGIAHKYMRKYHG